MDEAWLHWVLNDPDGIELVACSSDGKPVALAGCTWGPDDTSYHVLSDLAVDPFKRRMGLGKAALAAVMAWPGHPPSAYWATYVDPQNSVALAFFSGLGWQDKGIDNEMHRLEFFDAAPQRRVNRKTRCGLNTASR